MRSSAILQAGIIILLFTVPGFALASSTGDIKFYASGDPVYVSGKAPGTQSTGLAAWIFGQNYWSIESVDTESDGSYTYEIEGGLTGSLTPGQYFVIIQHPMYNGVFDVTPQAGVPSPGQTSAVSTDGGSFVIDGQGKLQGSAAAYALMNLLDSPNIDDIYTTTTFYLEEPWLRAGQTEAWPAGSVIRLEGTTNIAPGERLIYTLYPASGNIPSPKQSEDAAYTTEMAGQTEVFYGMPYNLWTLDIDTGGMDPGTYIFTIEAVSDGKTVQKYITLYEPVETTGSEVETAQPETEMTGGETVTETTAPAETPQASLSPVIIIVSLSAAAGIAAVSETFRRRQRKI